MAPSALARKLLAGRWVSTERRGVIARERRMCLTVRILDAVLDLAVCGNADADTRDSGGGEKPRGIGAPFPALTPGLISGVGGRSTSIV